MKKIIVVVLMLLLLSGCKEEIKKEDFYNVSAGHLYFVCGFDEKGNLQNDDVTNIKYVKQEIKGLFDKTKETKEILSYVEFYTEGNLLKIDGYVESDIVDACNDFNGELIEKNGVACYISKRVDGRENYIVLHGDILADDIKQIDRVEVGYDVKEVVNNDLLLFKK